MAQQGGQKICVGRTYGLPLLLWQHYDQRSTHGWLGAVVGPMGCATDQCLAQPMDCLCCVVHVLVKDKHRWLGVVVGQKVVLNRAWMSQPMECLCCLLNTILSVKHTLVVWSGGWPKGVPFLVQAMDCLCCCVQLLTCWYFL